MRILQLTEEIKIFFTLNVFIKVRQRKRWTKKFFIKLFCLFFHVESLPFYYYYLYGPPCVYILHDSFFRCNVMNVVRTFFSFLCYLLLNNYLIFLWL